MGNFYANLAMRSVDTDAIAAVLESHQRNAYVATVGDSTFVYDERCDAQDLDELRTLALIVARGARLPVLAVCNHDDDVLWIALADSGGAADVYDSYPGYFDGGSDQPKLSNLDRLHAAFDAPRDELDALLRIPHATMGFEVERHGRLMSILGMNPDAAVFGYRYVDRGELEDAVPSVTLRHVGSRAGSAASEAAFAEPVLPSPAMQVRSPVSGLTIREAMAALALTDVTVPDDSIVVFGEARLNGLVAFMRLQKYLVVNGRPEMRGPGDMVMHTDAVVERLLGVKVLRFVEVATRLVDSLDAWSSLSEANRQAIKAGNPGIQQWVADVMLRLTQDPPQAN